MPAETPLVFAKFLLISTSLFPGRSGLSRADATARKKTMTA